ncbi:MJ0144 family RNA dihydrouridine synthase-like protein [Methanobacterium oryzae]|uniref:MJ0144 family RNA dihydrouridine synthase-like protein n=1 Tax=Methanobacterium oryzae TaxID=69540 RepID=UPI003D1DE855
MESIEVLAPMAGITDGNFCKKMIPYGFDMLTIGGYNVDDATIAAGHSIIQRGRPEFNIKKENILPTIQEQAKIIKGSWDGIVSVNLRSTSPETIIEISKLPEIDVVEINAHCRQPEITEIGCGQALLYDLDKLHDFTKNVVKGAKSKVSVKIRANIENVDDIGASKVIENAGADYLHVDAMKPGYNHADHDIIRFIKENTEIFLIGNNSIRDLKSAQLMFSAGADGISMARITLKENIPFNLGEI